MEPCIKIKDFASKYQADLLVVKSIPVWIWNNKKVSNVEFFYPFVS